MPNLTLDVSVPGIIGIKLVPVIGWFIADEGVACTPDGRLAVVPDRVRRGGWWSHSVPSVLRLPLNLPRRFRLRAFGTS
jgi:hypothetical protein